MAAQPRPRQREERVRAARGRQAPPPEIRATLQRQRLLRAAAAEFAERGYIGATATSIATRAGMSEATFYAHFANKLDCMLALYDRANEVVGRAIVDALAGAGMSDAATRLRAATRAYLETVPRHPDFGHVLVVEIIGAGPQALAKRDQSTQLFADVLDAENAKACQHGLGPRFASPHDAYAIVGGSTELISRHVRLGKPKHLFEVAPVIDRMIDGVLALGSR